MDSFSSRFHGVSLDSCFLCFVLLSGGTAAALSVLGVFGSCSGARSLVLRLGQLVRPCGVVLCSEACLRSSRSAGCGSQLSVG